MEGFYSAVSLVVIVPLLGMLTNLFFGKKLGEKGAGFIAVSASAFAFVVALILWATLVDQHYEPAIVNAPLIHSWISIPSAGIDIPWQFRVDTLSVTMMLVVTGVGTLIHIYATGYMHGDERFPRFFVYLNLFLVFMLILVTGNNLLVMFVGWEGVGLCSFLLIGFWFDKPGKHPTEGTVGWSNSNAARKAFIVNRIGDFGLLMGIFLTFWTFGTLDYYKPHEVIHLEHDEAPPPVFAVEGAEGEHTGEEAAHVESGSEIHGIYTQAELWFEEGNHQVSFGSIDLDFDAVITLITLFFLLGATGKSAQIPLFVWLPDAMAGPTPVSALIHAATMVTAGIYMMVRSNSFFFNSDLTSFVVTIIGISTALAAGFMALGQWDIKKVLAYSTVSQLGFMVAAVGLGAYAAAMFHLVTHAFFKALLFLGSGSVIHAMEHGHHHAHEHGHDEHGDEHDEHAEHEAHGEHATHTHHDDHEFDPQDMRNMGGLAGKMRLTYITYLIGALALAGIFPLSGFWSKDEILADSYNIWIDEGELKGTLALVVLLAAAGMTAFYTWRQICLVFFGKPRTAAAEHAPESSSLMTTPLAILAIGAFLVGFANVPNGIPLLGWFFEWVFGEHRFTLFLEESVIHAHAGNFNAVLALLATGIALGAMYVSHTIYGSKAMPIPMEKDPLEENPQTQPLFALSNAKLYWDEAYFKYIVYPFQGAARFLANTIDWDFWHNFFHDRIIGQGFQGAADVISQPIDRQVVDKGFMSLATGVLAAASRLRKTQTGYVRTYALSLMMGVLLVIVIILLPTLRDLLGI
ncbi:MAG: hypothetical protein K8L91_23220 [Anaerolineae bacterium]|nr:hypothetical protein [Anaerolineae bacterium]